MPHEHLPYKQPFQLPVPKQQMPNHSTRGKIKSAPSATVQQVRTSLAEANHQKRVVAPEEDKDKHYENENVRQIPVRGLFIVSFECLYNIPGRKPLIDDPKRLKDSKASR